MPTKTAQKPSLRYSRTNSYYSWVSVSILLLVEFPTLIMDINTYVREFSWWAIVSITSILILL